MSTIINTEYDSGDDLISESRFIRLAGIKEKEKMNDTLNEKTKNARSEVSYSSSKASRKAYNKALRADAAFEIDSQISDMIDEEPDDRTIGDIVPISKEEWEGYSSGFEDADGLNNMPSEKEAYLYDLAYDVASGRIEMSADDISALDALVDAHFGWSFEYSVTGHGADLTADAQRDEYYDDYDDEPQWDEADQDWADQQDAGEYGNPWDGEDDSVLTESRLTRLAGLKERMEHKKVWK